MSPFKPVFSSSRREACLEYAVVRENTHGETSLGWADGVDKFILFDNNFFFATKEEKQKARTICTQFAALLNKLNY